jgi:hypothetical protein
LKGALRKFYACRKSFVASAPLWIP